MKSVLRFGLLMTVAFEAAAAARKPEDVLVVVNQNSTLSRNIGEYYARRRAIPSKNVCAIRTLDQEAISREEYDKLVAAPIAACLKTRGLIESILYIALTQGVPLR